MEEGDVGNAAIQSCPVQSGVTSLQRTAKRREVSQKLDWQPEKVKAKASSELTAFTRGVRHACHDVFP